jgi:hypothetical protein
MNIRRFVSATVLSAFIASNVASSTGQEVMSHAVAAQKTTSNNPTATLHDYDASGTTLVLLRSDDFNGIEQASYTSSSSHGSSLNSTFVNGEWNLNLGQQSPADALYHAQ